MSAIEEKLSRLTREIEAFMALRSELIRAHGDGYAVVQSGKLFGVFPTADDAFTAAMQTFGSTATFLVRRIKGEETLEAPALVLGLIDPTLP